MFGLFESQDKKMRDNAANWLELADKIYHYRRDVLAETHVAELQSCRAEVKALLKQRAGAAEMKLAIERLEEVLKRCGGSIYPSSGLSENIEFFLVAALVILGIRTYFVQPFKIPTNSMWPTYNGMTSEVYRAREEEPNSVAVAARAAAFGAWPHRLDAPVDGEIMIPVFGGSGRRGAVSAANARGTTWLVIPTDVREYSIVVGDAVVKTKLPLDFDFDWTVYDAFFAKDSSDTYSAQKLVEAIRQKQDAKQVVVRNIGGEPMECIRTGRFVKKGERVMSFDELTGDQLFVDRVSYHFMQPKVGQGFVFRTDHIDSIYMRDASNKQLEQYYIKRLVGLPGDTLEVQEPVLLRNGQPIAGSVAFDANASRRDRYSGYQAIGELVPGRKITIPEKRYFAMGDNSSNSQDGRYWGTVPAKDVVGRPLFVYYPFTKHWGPAR